MHKYSFEGYYYIDLWNDICCPCILKVLVLFTVKRVYYVDTYNYIVFILTHDIKMINPFDILPRFL